jgi:hypothetical protein
MSFNIVRPSPVLHETTYLIIRKLLSDAGLYRGNYKRIDGQLPILRVLKNILWIISDRDLNITYTYSRTCKEGVEDEYQKYSFALAVVASWYSYVRIDSSIRLPVNVFANPIEACMAYVEKVNANASTLGICINSVEALGSAGIFSSPNDVFRIKYTVTYQRSKSFDITYIMAFSNRNEYMNISLKYNRNMCSVSDHTVNCMFNGDINEQICLIPLDNLKGLKREVAKGKQRILEFMR